MVVPEDYFEGPVTITEIVFSRAPMGASSVVMEGFKISMGLAGGEELGREFAGNLAQDSTVSPVFFSSSATAADDGNGMVVFPLDTPFEYTGGNLLIDMSFTDIQGNMYLWSWDSGGNTMLSANGVTADTGYPHSYPPMIILRGQ